MPTPPATPFRERRRFLRLVACVPALALLLPLTACSRKPHIDATFLQLWQSHLQLGRDDWMARMAAMHALGSNELVLQWVGLHGGSEPAWRLPDASMQHLLDAAGANGMRVRIGLPCDQGWWAVLGRDAQAQAAFFERSLHDARRYIHDSPWSRHAQFAGWYIPYEIEQYHWAEPAAQQRLGQWLAALSQASGQAGHGVPAISTYFSKLATQGDLVQLWQHLLQQAHLRPMVQDGVGVAGWDNLKAIEPLLGMLRGQRMPFDVIVELFEQLPSENNDGTEFKARSADYPRVARQLEWASATGAAQVVAFALDPWVLQDDAAAQALRQQWRKARA
ncbi:DUF4434 domain-containing protein [Pseudomonas sp. MAFF212428]|uniref:DUF4434 domain-containing protein n=1 Tax=Pseudomonas brassicae TaxID=2708063 RepID=A0A6B3NUY7_9PSED|nr:DUF4434 domain-containing protein [Pseudomonas brassicae]NER60828.1 DUF4434 domain-containing protein [Pseudomonas brassicae]NER63367.1 DUF4434 domain-containing protein [Pseudomonas brassicae]